ncbi:MAG: Uma2 family endonuclease [Thermosynechococcaceae cyanobacterium]
MYQGNSPTSVQKPLPTMYDLPSEYPEELGLPDEFHAFQPQLLRETCQLPDYSADDIFIGTDINVYYDSRHTPWHKRPDWFLVLGVPQAKQQEDLRWSYVIWQEGVSPFLVVELLSPGTEDEDLGRSLRQINQPPGKWEVYERILRVPYYVVFDRYENNFRLFQLTATRYQELEITDNRYWFEELDLGLGVWEGDFQAATGQWLRWYDAAGHWIPTSAEFAEQEKQRAEQETQRANQETQRANQEAQRADREQQRAERLAERLRELGVDPEI